MDLSKIPLTGNGLPTVYVDLETCYETFPCKHKVTYESGTTTFLSAKSIVTLYTDRGLIPDSHFMSKNKVVCIGEDSDASCEDDDAIMFLDNDKSDDFDCCCND